MKPTTNKIEKIPLSFPIATHHICISVSVDFFFANGHTFLTSNSAKVGLITEKYHKTRGLKGIIDMLNEIGKINISRGFKIDNIHGDNEFNADKIKSSQLLKLFHACGRDDHVGIIERSNRTIKNKARKMMHTAPYEKYLRL